MKYNVYTCMNPLKGKERETVNNISRSDYTIEDEIMKDTDEVTDSDDNQGKNLR